MWYNIIPSFAIVTGVLAVPAVFIAGLHKLVYDNVSGWLITPMEY